MSAPNQGRARSGAPGPRRRRGRRRRGDGRGDNDRDGDSLASSDRIDLDGTEIDPDLEVGVVRGRPVVRALPYGPVLLQALDEHDPWAAARREPQAES